MGAIKAFEKAGYGTQDKPFPILTGQDCDKLNVMAILEDKQSMSVFKDTRDLAIKTVEMTENILKGNDVEINDNESYNNGKKVIQSYLCNPIYVDKNNYKDVLISSGYYAEEDIK